MNDAHPTSTQAGGLHLHRERLLALLNVPESGRDAQFFVARTAPGRAFAESVTPMEFTIGFYEDEGNPRVECDVSALPDDGDREEAITLIGRADARDRDLFLVPDEQERDYMRFHELLRQARGAGLVLMYGCEA